LGNWLDLWAHLDYYRKICLLPYRKKFSGEEQELFMLISFSTNIGFQDEGGKHLLMWQLTW